MREDNDPPVNLPSLDGYEVVKPLGGGGMGLVYLARQSRLERWVVLKTLSPRFFGQPESVRMFEREARIAARLQHPNLVVVFDVLSTPQGPFLAMEYIEGVSYQALLGRADLPLDCHLFVLQRLLAGLDYLHNLTDDEGRPLGLVHRDISPDNVMVTVSGEVKLVDLGIAKAGSSGSGDYATQVPTIKGKARYMSPEQARGADGLDARADLYAVGAMLWEAVAGRARWSEELTDSDVLTQLIETGSSPTIDPPGGTRHGLPMLDAIAVRALSGQRQRHASAVELLTELREAQPDLGEAQTRLAEAIRLHFGKEIDARKRAAPAAGSGELDSSWQTVKKQASLVRPATEERGSARRSEVSRGEASPWARWALRGALVVGLVGIAGVALRFSSLGGGLEHGSAAVSPESTPVSSEAPPAAGARTQHEEGHTTSRSAASSGERSAPAAAASEKSRAAGAPNSADVGSADVGSAVVDAATGAPETETAGAKSAGARSNEQPPRRESRSQENASSGKNRTRSARSRAASRRRRARKRKASTRARGATPRPTPQAPPPAAEAVPVYP